MPDSSYADVKKRFEGYKHSNMFEPLSKEGTIVAPGLDGGAEWGGPSYDPTTGILYVNANEMVNLLQIVDLKSSPRHNETFLTAGQRLYQTNCMACHGPERLGSANYPSLIDVNKKYNEQEFIQLVSTGRRMMPAFTRLDDEEKKAIASVILIIIQRNKKSLLIHQNLLTHTLKCLMQLRVIIYFYRKKVCLLFHHPTEL